MTGQRVTAVDDLAGLLIVAAPEAEGLMADQRFPLGHTGYNRLTLNYSFHNVSSLTTRPATAELTQSARLPKTT